MTLRTPKPTREERAAMAHDELLRSVWLLDDVIESFRWIPVGQRLPEIRESVLVTLWDGTITVAVWYGGRWGTAHKWSEEVLAWMPLPEPYSPLN